jgi:hypothetical protein
LLLGLAQNVFSGELPSTMASMSNLAIIAVDGNMLTGTLDVPQDLTSLEAVYLEQNAFTGTIDESFLEKTDQLTQLDASDNLLVGSVPVHLLGLPTTRVLDLHSNLLTGFSDIISATETCAR